MKKVAVFTEGLTELIFVRECLLRLIDSSKLSFECFELQADRILPTRYKYSCPNPQVYFMIINVRGDEKVLSAIADREKGLVEKGCYERIIGLRDMYSGTYDRLAHGVINENISKQFIANCNATIQNMTYGNRIKLYFAIMEIEAWFLAMYNLFQKIHCLLTVNYIRQNLNIDLKGTDPQNEFFKPSKQVEDIFELCGRRYRKKESDIESITSKMELADFDNARENDRCKCFDSFYQEVIN